MRAQKTNSRALWRLLYDLAVCAAVLFFPRWLTFLIIAPALFLFSPYYEALAAGVAIDALYGAPKINNDAGFSFWNPSVMSTAIILSAIFLVIEFIKPMVRLCPL